MIETLFQTEIKAFRSNNIEECINIIIGEYFKNNGIIQQSLCFDTSQPNWIIERKYRHLLWVAQFFMFSMNVLKHFYGKAISIAAYFISRMPSHFLKFKNL